MPPFADETSASIRSGASPGHLQAEDNQTVKRRMETSLAPRVLSRAEAAAYCGCSPGLFSDWIRRGIIPGPIPGTHRWDRKAIDVALDRISGLTVSIADPFDEWKARRNARTAQRHSHRQDAPG